MGCGVADTNDVASPKFPELLSEISPAPGGETLHASGANPAKLWPDCSTSGRTCGTMFAARIWSTYDLGCSRQGILSDEK